MPWNFICHFAQVAQSMRAAPIEAIMTAEVGTMRFVKPSPSWKASTATWRVTPAISASLCAVPE